jgi:DNA-binding CsgD family transcriptional regulator
VPFEKLTRREREILEQTASGKSTKQIAFQLGIAFKTAACHRQRIVNRLDATNIVDAICRAARMALIDLHSNRATPSPGGGALRATSAGESGVNPGKQGRTKAQRTAAGRQRGTHCGDQDVRVRHV